MIARATKAENATMVERRVLPVERFQEPAFSAVADDLERFVAVAYQLGHDRVATPDPARREYETRGSRTL